MKKTFPLFAFIIIQALLVSCVTTSNAGVSDALYQIGFENKDDFEKFKMIKGASLGADPKWSKVEIDDTISHTGSSALRLTANAETQKFYSAEIDLPVENKKYTATFYINGKGIKREGKQFNSAYAGFIIRYKNGKKRFITYNTASTQDWIKVSRSIRLTGEKAIQSMSFAVFLSKTGTMWLDDIQISIQ